MQKSIQASRENLNITVVSLFLLLHSLLAYALLTALTLTKVNLLLHWAKHSTVLSGSLTTFILLPMILKYFEVSKMNLPASRSFPMSQLFASSGQSIGVPALASVLPNYTQDWSPSGWTGWISLQSKGLARVFSNTTVQKHQFFGAQLSSQSNSHIHTWPLGKPWPWLDGP